MQLTPIPDSEAAKILAVSHNTIRNAVKRGDLTRLPLPGKIQQVAREQVILYRGKTRVVIGDLPLDKRQEWQSIHNHYYPVPAAAPRQDEIKINPDLAILAYEEGRTFIRQFMRGITAEVTAELTGEIEKKNYSDLLSTR